MLLYLFMLGYAATRAAVLFGDGNPIISDYTIIGEIELDRKVDLLEHGFKLAFQVENINSFG